MNETPSPMDFLKSLWGPLGVPMPGMMAPTLDTDEIGKRIADLKAVENWMTVNMTMLRASIQGLEAQKAALDAFKAAGQAMAGTPPPGSGASTTPGMEAWWSVLQGQMPPKTDPKK
jgi:hypothetical protein